MRRNPRAGARASGGLRLEVFSGDELHAIHSATLEVLSRTGVFVEDDEPLDIFADGGCRVDRDTRMVRVPPHVVADALAACPPTIAYCGRTPDRDFIVDHLPGHENVFLVVDSAHGFKFSSLLGRILSELALDGRTGSDVSGFGYARPILHMENPPRSFMV